MTEKDTEDNNFAVVTRIEDHDFNNYLSNRFPYRIGDVANMLTHPRVNGKNKLFRFLREYNIFKENVPLLQYKDLGYFMVDYRFHVIGNVNCPITWVSIEGVEFIKNLITEVLGENFIGTPSAFREKTRKINKLKYFTKMKKTDFFSITNAVGISGIAQMNTYNTLFTFLEQYGIFHNGVPKVEFVNKGYFTVEYIEVSWGKMFRTVEVINVSRRGLQFIKQLAKLIHR